MAALPPGFRLWDGFLPPSQCAALFTALEAGIRWERHVLRMFGRWVPMPRQTAWFGPHGYGYSGAWHPAAPLLPALADVQAAVAAETAQPYNSVLLNRYADGQDCVGWHSDDDYDPGPHAGVASVSLGATRRFRLRNRHTRETVRVDLVAGSLLLMGPGTQRDWQHALPRSKKCLEVRINLTFRYVFSPGKTPR